MYDLIWISHIVRVKSFPRAVRCGRHPWLVFSIHLSFLPPLISPIMRRWHRSMVLVTSFVGALFNSVLAVQLFTLWRSLKRDSESEWEGSLDPWTVNSLSLLGGLSAAYFVTAAVASAIGFAGIVKVSQQPLASLVILRAATQPVCNSYRRAYPHTFGFIAIFPSQTSRSAPSPRSSSHTPRSVITRSAPEFVRSSHDMPISCGIWPRRDSAQRTVSNGSRGPSWSSLALCSSSSSYG